MRRFDSGFGLGMVMKDLATVRGKETFRGGLGVELGGWACRWFNDGGDGVGGAWGVGIIQRCWSGSRRRRGVGEVSRRGDGEVWQQRRSGLNRPVEL